MEPTLPMFYMLGLLIFSIAGTLKQAPIWFILALACLTGFYLELSEPDGVTTSIFLLLGVILGLATAVSFAKGKELS